VNFRNVEIFTVMRNWLLSSLLLILAASALHAQQRQTEYVFLLTLDGLRWQELYGGIDSVLMTDDRYVDDAAALREHFWAPTPEARREKLMPFFWSTIAKEGQLLGNRWLGNRVDVTNNHWFSYPGYGEILTGFADPRINSNDKTPNPNRTVLEWINGQPGFEGRVAAFASWDVFPYIINEERSGIPVNAGFEKATHDNLSFREVFLNQLQDEIPSPWGSVRLDAFTHHYALEYVHQYHPRVLYIAYGETDDFAHDGEYDQYIKSAHQTDRWIQSLWEYVQSDPVYRGRTAFMITTDHGRGDKVKEEWTSHGADVEGSGAIWLAAIGPDMPALGEHRSEGRYYQNQVAKTLAALLGLDYAIVREVGKVIAPLLP
jgi:hypothetical protein